MFLKDSTNITSSSSDDELFIKKLMKLKKEILPSK